MAINERKANEVYLNYKKRIFYFECQFHTMIMLSDLYVSIGNIIFVYSRCLFLILMALTQCSVIVISKARKIVRPT